MSAGVFFGAVGDPRLQDNVTLKGVQLPIRRWFEASDWIVEIG